jgi:hypothetical protein
MRVTKALVVVLLTLLALVIGAWGGWMAVSGVLGNGTEDIAPVFFVVFGSMLLVLAVAIAWVALMTHRGPGGPRRWSLMMMAVLVLGVALGMITGFWLGVLLLVGVVILATGVKPVARSSE